ncbi:MAG: hypothetical protein A2087_12635 [Spirochaetes bacterium GWD1_61_31]|nr:MAG: hypothetical protein A2Y37_11375 [Spirochaetes bacterium GWB1_60_80]OHD32989.1 MAG: hypothetical protein A2004_07265 [Spirochaetes bacterium GWC1_61_12]OHD38363.1 MAG: hypothetical protein A2087_12635 [Spirochaetes bacterium GWD1_61_31]OHD43370.1 MAG: hypothetical protein A2Y35_02145 [Spirochaetes bacterium GWE1_60_18]OHD58901.1 MAG: hypothetical protein A2Y32_10585 [Spirochaetes bacterium GWF1_60_12]HAP44347.1 hypothetical protein [Spirochaetaceae bacterium]
MKSTEIIDALEAVDDDGDLGQTQAAATSRLFVFSVGELLFALPPEVIREIVAGLEVYPLPACPPYVPGLINSHGEPHTVFDLRVLFENERQAVDKFLVLKLDDDSVAFGCSDVNEIVEVKLSEISTFADTEAEGRFCSALFQLDGRQVMILSVSHVLAQLEHDLG